MLGSGSSSIAKTLSFDDSGLNPCPHQMLSSSSVNLLLSLFLFIAMVLTSRARTMFRLRVLRKSKKIAEDKNR